MLEISTYRAEQFDGVRGLWEEAFPNDPPWNKAELAIPEKLKVQPELFIVAQQSGSVVGTAMAGYDGHRGWLYTIAVRQSDQRKGIGSALLTEAEHRLTALGCGKINLQIRAGNEAVTAFYSHHGYEIEERVNLGKRIAAGR